MISSALGSSLFCACFSSSRSVVELSFLRPFFPDLDFWFYCAFQGLSFLDFGVSRLLLVCFTLKSLMGGVFMSELLPPVSEAVEFPFTSFS